MSFDKTKFLSWIYVIQCKLPSVSPYCRQSEGSSSFLNPLWKLLETIVKLFKPFWNYWKLLWNYFKLLWKLLKTTVKTIENYCENYWKLLWKLLNPLWKLLEAETAIRVQTRQCCSSLSLKLFMNRALGNWPKGANRLCPVSLLWCPSKKTILTNWQILIHQ